MTSEFITVAMYRDAVRDCAELRADNARLRATCTERDAEIGRLDAEIERLQAALQRIDGINDNPACFNPMIDEVLRAALGPKP